MKHLPIADVPPPEPEKPVSDKSAPPPDSAYSSGTDRMPRRREPKQLNGARPDSTVGPLPFASDQLPDATNNQHLMPKENGSPSVKSLASTSKSRSLNSIKSIFQGRFRVSAR